MIKSVHWAVLFTVRARPFLAKEVL